MAKYTNQTAAVLSADSAARKTGKQHAVFFNKKTGFYDVKASTAKKLKGETIVYFSR
jgi:hypothetical protein